MDHLHRLSVKKVFTQFRSARTSINNTERSELRKDVIRPEIVDIIQGLILDDQRIKKREMEEAVCISTERAHHIYIWTRYRNIPETKEQPR